MKQKSKTKIILMTLIVFFIIPFLPISYVVADSPVYVGFEVGEEYSPPLF